MQFGVLPLRRLKVSSTSLSLVSFAKNGSKITVIFGLVLITLFFLTGCASKKGRVSDTDYLSMLPEDADIYLHFPVQENSRFASQLITSFAPNIEAADTQKLIKRFNTIYGAVKNGQFSAVATGSFPKLGLSFALKEKNGWKKIKDSAIPVTGAYYQYQNLPFQLAFPSSSVLMMASQVDELLSSYEQQIEGTTIIETHPLAVFVTDHEYTFTENNNLDENTISKNQSIDFYVSDVVSVVLPIVKTTLPINLPLTDLYGSFIPQDDSTENTSTEEFEYSFVGYLGLSDGRAMKPALTVLKLVSRGLLGFDVTYTSVGDTTIKISGVTVSEKVLGDLLKKALQ